MSNKSQYIVKHEFRDIANFDKVHAVGSDVSHFDEDRLTKLVELGLVETGEQEEQTT